MRKLNSQDTINLIFDSRLLNAQAIQNLKYFCQKHTIQYHDVFKDITPLCTTESEIKLLKLYNNEISNVDSGGNLGVASDYLRWLSPIHISNTVWMPIFYLLIIKNQNWKIQMTYHGLQMVSIKS